MEYTRTVLIERERAQIVVAVGLVLLLVRVVVVVAGVVGVFVLDQQIGEGDRLTAGFGRHGFDRSIVRLDGVIVVALTLVLVAFGDELGGGLFGFRHGGRFDAHARVLDRDGATTGSGRRRAIFRADGTAKRGAVGGT